MAFKFCPECGVQIDQGSSFCTGCGKPLGRVAAGGGAPARIAGLVALSTLLALGGGFWLWHRLSPEPPRGPKPGDGRVAAAGPAAPVAGGAAPAAGAAPGAGGGGHPKLELPDDIRQYIDGLARDADAKPKDVNAWQTLARVYYRASRLDPSFAAKADGAFRHLLELEPKNLEGLRGVANLAYDRQERDFALDYYGRYLEQKPDDPEVRTDLATMLFEGGDRGRAILEYRKVIEKNPKFFQAWFNLAVVQDANGETAAARTSLQKAREFATEDQVKQRITSLLDATKDGKSFAEAADKLAATAPPAGAGPGAAAPGGNPAGAVPPAPATAARAGSGAGEPKTFVAAVEALFRGHPIAGPKIAAVEWPSADRGRVVMSGFPMDQMPEVMRNSWTGKMKAGIDEARKRFSVAAPVTVEIVDQESGRVMATIGP